MAAVSVESGGRGVEPVARTPLRTWGLALWLVGTTLVPQVASVFFASAAVAPLEGFLGRSTGRDPLSSGLWHLFLNVEPMVRAAAIFAAPLVADSLGRRATLGLSLLLTVPGNLLQAGAGPLGCWEALFAGRVLNTMGRALSGDILVVVFAEMAGLGSGGRMKVLVTVATSLSVSASAFLGLPEVLGNESWPLAYAGLGLLAALAAPAVFLMRETPAFLGRRAKESAARRAAFEASLRFYFGSTDRAAAVLCDSGARRTRNGCTALAAVLALPRHLAIIAALNLATAFPNLLRSFSTEIFGQVGLSYSEAAWATSVLRVCSSLAVVSTLLFVDRVRRRPHMFWTLAVVVAGLGAAAVVQGLPSSALGAAGPWASVGCLTLASVGSDLGPKCLSQLIPAEIYPHQLRMGARTALLLSGSGLSLALGFAALPLMGWLGGAELFGLLLVLLLLSAATLARLLPETAGREVADVLADMARPSSASTAVLLDQPSSALSPAADRASPASAPDAASTDSGVSSDSEDSLP